MKSKKISIEDKIGIFGAIILIFVVTSSLFRSIMIPRLLIEIIGMFLVGIAFSSLSTKIKLLIVSITYVFGIILDGFFFYPMLYGSNLFSISILNNSVVVISLCLGIMISDLSKLFTNIKKTIKKENDNKYLMKVLAISIFIVTVIISCNVNALLINDNISNIINSSGEVRIGHINIQAINETSKNISIFVFSPFDYSTSMNNFILSNMSTNVSINLTIPNDFPSGMFPITIMVQYFENNSTHIWTLKRNISIAPIQSFFIEPQNITINTTTNSSEKINITLINDGNSVIDVNVSGDVHLKYKKHITLYPQTEDIFYLEYDIPINMTPGQYNLTVVFNASNIQKNFTIKTNIRDNINPKFSIIYKPELTYGDIQNVNMTAYDNIAVNSTFISIRDPEGRVITSKKFKVDKIGLWDIDVVVKDDYGNINATSLHFYVNKIKTNLTNKTVYFGKIKVDRVASILIFNTTRNIPLNITLHKIQCSDKCPKIEIAGYELVANKSIIFEEKSGVLYAGVFPNSTGKVNFIINIRTADYVEPTEYSYNISGEFINYTIMENYDTTWFGYPVSCKANDTGNLYTSSYICEIKYPASINISDLALPTAPGWIEDLKRTQSEKLRKYTNDIAFLGSVNTILILTLIIMVVIFSWKLFISPKFRFRWR